MRIRDAVLTLSAAIFHAAGSMKIDFRSIGGRGGFGWWMIQPPYQPDSPDFESFVMGTSPAVWIE